MSVFLKRPMALLFRIWNFAVSTFIKSKFFLPTLLPFKIIICQNTLDAVIWQDE